MASKSAAFLLSLNLLFFTVVTSIPSSEATGAVPPSSESTGIVPDNCPRDALKLGVCLDVLNGLLGLNVGSTPQSEECCSLIGNLVKLDAGVCLCTSLQINVLNLIDLNLGVDLSLLLNYCKVPTGFECP